MQHPLPRWVVFFVLTMFALCSGGCRPSTMEPGEVSVQMTLTSTAFSAGSPIPVRFTGQGADISPDLLWTGAPPTTKSYVLICEDPDAPGGTWIHWTMWNIPASVTNLSAGVPRDQMLKDGSVQGVTSFGRHGYEGPMPPRGPAHRYYFRVYALDTTLTLDASATRQQLGAAMAGHVLSQAELKGTYQRQ